MLVKTFGSRHWIMAATGRWDVSQYAMRMQGPANTALVRYADRFEGDLGFFVGPIRFTKFIQALSLSLSLLLIQPLRLSVLTLSSLYDAAMGAMT